MRLRIVIIISALLLLATITAMAAEQQQQFDMNGWRLADLIILLTLTFNVGITVQKVNMLKERVKELSEELKEVHLICDAKASRVHDRIDDILRTCGAGN